MDDLEPDPHDVIVDRIKTLATEKGLSVNRLADFSGLSRSYMSTVLRKKNSPTVKTLMKIAAALEVQVRDLIC